jgi:hypothetical protein
MLPTATTEEEEIIFGTVGATSCCDGSDHHWSVLRRVGKGIGSVNK